MKKTVLFTVLTVLAIGQNTQATKLGNLFTNFKNKGMFTTFKNTSMLGSIKNMLGGLFASLTRLSTFKKFHAEKKTSEYELALSTLEEQTKNALKRCKQDYTAYLNPLDDSHYLKNKYNWNQFSRLNCPEYIQLQKALKCLKTYTIED